MSYERNRIVSETFINHKRPRMTTHAIAHKGLDTLILVVIYNAYMNFIEFLNRQQIHYWKRYFLFSYEIYQLYSSRMFVFVSVSEKCFDL